MRRVSVLGALTAALLAPAVALGGPLDIERGKAARGDEFRVGFRVISQGGKPKEIRHFRFKNVAMSCEAGTPNPFLTNSKAPHFGPMGVNGQGRFGRVFGGGGKFDGTVNIRGEFKTKRKVEGTLKVQGDYAADGPAGPWEDCTSGKLEWNAQLGP